MGWVRLDDGFIDHPKIAQLSDKAVRLYVEMLCRAAVGREAEPDKRPLRELIGAGLVAVDGSLQLADLYRLPPLRWRKHGRPRNPIRKAWDAMRNKVAAIIFERDGYRCVNCGTAERLEIDHRIPIVRGGGNDFDNLQTLCRTCNRRKWIS